MNQTTPSAVVFGKLSVKRLILSVAAGQIRVLYFCVGITCVCVVGVVSQFRGSVWDAKNSFCVWQFSMHMLVHLHGE